MTVALYAFRELPHYIIYRWITLLITHVVELSYWLKVHASPSFEASDPNFFKREPGRLNVLKQMINLEYFFIPT